MAEFLSIALDDGTILLFQNPNEDLVAPRGGQATVEPVDHAVGRLEDLAHGASILCDSLRNRLGPDEICLELGAGLSGEVGWFFAKSSVDATIKISLTWKKTESKDS